MVAANAHGTLAGEVGICLITNQHNEVGMYGA